MIKRNSLKLIAVTLMLGALCLTGAATCYQSVAHTCYTAGDVIYLGSDTHCGGSNGVCFSEVWNINFTCTGHVCSTLVPISGVTQNGNTGCSQYAQSNWGTKTVSKYTCNKGCVMYFQDTGVFCSVNCDEASVSGDPCSV